MNTSPESLVWLSVATAACAGGATLSIWLIPVLKRLGAVAPPGPANCGRPVPRGGGLAIVAVVVIAAGAAAWLTPDSRPALGAWLVPAAAVAAVSLWDDCRPLPALGRLCVHVAAAATVVAALGPIEEVAIAGRAWRLGEAAWPLSLLWIVGMTNAFNFMDGIDGIAGLTAVAAGASLAAAAATAGNAPVGLVAAAFAAAAAGFLTTNWPPAKLFMGDVGSTFCGFSIAVLPLVVGPAGRPAVVAVAGLAMLPFVVDSGLTLAGRIGRRENVLETHRGHLYQRLVIGGWSQARVAALYGALAALGGAFGLALQAG